MCIRDSSWAAAAEKLCRHRATVWARSGEKWDKKRLSQHLADVHRRPLTEISLDRLAAGELSLIHI